MNTNNLKIGDIVSIEPFGDSPTHYCKIKHFQDCKELSAVFAMGDWYSKKGNRIIGTGFDVNYTKQSNSLDLQLAINSHEEKIKKEVDFVE